MHVKYIVVSWHACSRFLALSHSLARMTGSNAANLGCMQQDTMRFFSFWDQCCHAARNTASDCLTDLKQSWMAVNYNSHHRKMFVAFIVTDCVSKNQFKGNDCSIAFLLANKNRSKPSLELDCIWVRCISVVYLLLGSQCLGSIWPM